MGPIRTVIRPPPGAAAGDTAVSSAFNLIPRRPRTPSSPYSLSNHHASHTSTSSSPPYSLSNHHVPQTSRSSSPFYHLQRAYTQATTINHTHPKLSTRTLIPTISHRVNYHTAIQNGEHASRALDHFSTLQQPKTGCDVAMVPQGSEISALSSGMTTMPLSSLYQHFKQHLPPGPSLIDDSGNARRDEKSNQMINKQIMSKESSVICSSNNKEHKITTYDNKLYSTRVEEPELTTYPFNMSDDEESEEMHGGHQNWKISDIVETDEEGVETRTSTPTGERKTMLNLSETDFNESERESRFNNLSKQVDNTRKTEDSDVKETLMNESQHVHSSFSGESTKHDSCSYSGEQPGQCNNSQNLSQRQTSCFNKWLHTESESNVKTKGYSMCQPNQIKNINITDTECHTDLDNESIDVSSDEDNPQSNGEVDLPDGCDAEGIIKNQSGTRSPKSGTQTDGTRSTARLRPSSYRQFLTTRERRSRVFLKARSHHLGRWFVIHFSHPYPSKDQKDQLAAKTNMNRNQVSEWFGNMRRRIREATRRLNLCWEERVRVYNNVITGKSEPLPILPDDAINFWEPPTVIDSSQTDSQEETTASRKFKRTLLHRYLHDSYETSEKVGDVSHWNDFQEFKGNSVVSNSKKVQTTSKVKHKNKLHELPSQSKSVKKYPVNHLDVIQNQFEKQEKIFHHTAPLCTSSPKEHSVITWNNQIDDFNKDHSQISSQMPKDQAQQKSQTLYGYAPKLLYKQKSPTNNSTDQLVGCKKPLLLSPIANWLSQTTSNGLSNYFLTSKIRPEKVKDQLTNSLSMSYPNTQNNVEVKGPGVSNLVIHKPEELAAAYTLVQLQQM
ncbi:unnamed protein product [Meganyctiphanes norvegica]|uniref:Homeobox domain-containing protein n=1 Tax=Meganyctiphanes norvegica TaxID=48144 RepID=A0AAV2Q7U9_MEGNR